jgi:imidazolonepropionase-like amidohydrolase
MSADPAPGKPTVLIRNARCVATMDDTLGELRDTSILVRGNLIEALAPADALAAQADVVIDASRHLVVPGMVNTHHHMFQCLTRAVPAAQDAELFAWLRQLYPIWANLTPEMVHTATQLAMAELLQGQPRGQHPRRAGDRHALRGLARQREHGRKRGRPRPGPPHRERGRGAGRVPAPDRDLA